LAGHPRSDIWFPGGTRYLSRASRQALGPTQLPIQWVLGVKWPDYEFHLSLKVPRFRMGEAVPYSASTVLKHFVCMCACMGKWSELINMEELKLTLHITAAGQNHFVF
jgi:hypothetical protein